jgi:nucleotide-binding universal stress UspA family protein
MLPIKKILCPTDFSEPSYEAVRAAAELASHFGSEVILFHAVPVLPPLPADPNFVLFGIEEYERALQGDAERKLMGVIEQLIPKGLASRFIVARGDAATEIVRAAEAERADLIVIATHGLTGWRHLVFGSVAEKVVRLSPCPVLTIRKANPETQRAGRS